MAQTGCHLLCIFYGTEPKLSRDCYSRWMTSWRERDLPLTRRLDQGDGKLLTPPLYISLGMYISLKIPTLVATRLSQGGSTESSDHLEGFRDRTQRRALCELTRFRCGDTVLPPPRTSLVGEFPCLLQFAAYPSGVVGLSLWSLFALGVQGPVREASWDSIFSISWDKHHAHHLVVVLQTLRGNRSEQLGKVTLLAGCDPQHCVLERLKGGTQPP